MRLNSSCGSWSSVLPLALTCFWGCTNAGFEDSNLIQHDGGAKAQFKHVNFTFPSAQSCLQEKGVDWTQKAATSWTKSCRQKACTHLKHSALPRTLHGLWVATICIWGPDFPSVLDNPLTTCSQSLKATTLWHPVPHKHTSGPLQGQVSHIL